MNTAHDKFFVIDSNSLLTRRGLREHARLIEGNGRATLMCKFQLKGTAVANVLGRAVDYAADCNRHFFGTKFTVEIKRNTFSFYHDDRCVLTYTVRRARVDELAYPTHLM